MLPKKSLGQNFLRCRWVVDTIIAASDLTRNDVALEIGPGTGVLTRALAKHAGRVIAIEKDEKLAASLRATLKTEKIQNVEIIEGDILQIYSDILIRYCPQTTNYKLIANIPYYLTTRIFRTVFEQAIKPSLILFTIQKEVAQRITAHAPRMSILSLSIQAYGKPKIIKHVPASCFYPKPSVDSSIIKISNITDDFFTNNPVPEKDFFNVIKIGFSSKRKQLAGNLAAGIKIPKENIRAVFTELNLNPRARAEQLTLNQWAHLASSISALESVQ